MTITRTKRDRLRERDRLSNMIDILAMKFVRDIRNEINRAMRALADSLNKSMLLDEAIIEDHKKRLQRLFISLLSVSVEASSERQFQFIKKSYSERGIKKSALEDFEELAMGWILDRGLELSKTVAETTKKETAIAIARSVEGGFAVSTIIKFIKDKAKVTSRRRAEMIARTETHTASSWASMESTNQIAKEENIALNKVWNVVEDSRTRSAHVSADGQAVPIDSRFLIDGEFLEFPGDPRGSAGNVINCRCVMTYERIS